MNFKRVKRKCFVRGCKNTDCFHISRNREIGNSVIICKECLRDALESVCNAKPLEKQRLESPPALFFSQKQGQAEKEQNNISHEKSEEVNQETENSHGEMQLVCQKCGKQYKTEKAYLVHCKKCEGVN